MLSSKEGQLASLVQAAGAASSAELHAGAINVSLCSAALPLWWQQVQACMLLLPSPPCRTVGRQAQALL